MTAQVTDADFETKVLKATRPVLVDFYADWCGPCQAIAPHVDALAKDKENVIDVYKMNIDENPMVPSQNNIRSIPTFIIFKDGQAASTKMGSMPKTVLTQWVEDNTK